MRNTMPCASASRTSLRASSTNSRFSPGSAGIWFTLHSSDGSRTWAERPLSRRSWDCGENRKRGEHFPFSASPPAAAKRRSFDRNLLEGQRYVDALRAPDHLHHVVEDEPQH